MDAKERRRSDKDFFEHLRFLENPPPDYSPYALPRDFTPDEWGQLSLEEKLVCMRHDSERLERVIKSLEVNLLEARIVAAMAGCSILGLLGAIIFY